MGKMRVLARALARIQEKCMCIQEKVHARAPDRKQTDQQTHRQTGGQTDRPANTMVPPRTNAGHFHIFKSSLGKPLNILGLSRKQHPQIRKPLRGRECRVNGTCQKKHKDVNLQERAAELGSHPQTDIQKNAMCILVSCLCFVSCLCGHGKKCCPAGGRNASRMAQPCKEWRATAWAEALTPACPGKGLLNWLMPREASTAPA